MRQTENKKQKMGFQVSNWWTKPLVETTKKLSFAMKGKGEYSLLP